MAPSLSFISPLGMTGTESFKRVVLASAKSRCSAECFSGNVTGELRVKLVHWLNPLVDLRLLNDKNPTLVG